MGIINVTRDSFFPESRETSVRAAVEKGLAFRESGADSIDVGGESTRPGSEYVSEAQELERVVPVIEALVEEVGLPVSVDTRKASVASAAIRAGATMVNDVSALRDDPEMIPLCAAEGVSVVLMHMRGTPKTMQQNPSYQETVGEISSELSEWAQAAMAGGVPREQIILDPGIGFGKRQRDNLLILKELHRFRELGFPLLVGLSRKSFLGRIIGGDSGPAPVEDRGAATLAAHSWCIAAGVDYLRVHDVAETRDARAVINAIREVGEA
jgi:dihydropteroate synthase